ncbi:cytochrome bc1 complex cytochrome b subunit [Parenemella sanctibonifatiensis]
MAKPSKVDTTTENPQAHKPEGKHAMSGLAGPAKWVDERVGIAGLSKGNLRKVFPDHWSFLLGEIALYSFIICLLTGVFLTLWFKPSMAEIHYDGSYQLLKGLAMSEAYASTLEISFDVRGGLLMRQIHHWAALLFIASIFAHCLRVFFTGAFRKPREINWLIGVGLMALAMVEGFAGYSLPDDLLSGTGLRFVDGLVRSIPIIGTWAEFFVFGGEFPGDIIVARLYMVHILLLPGLLLGLIAAHMALLVFHKHTQYAGPGRTERNVVGYPLFPVYMAKAGGFFFIVFGVIVLIAALIQINPVWTYGPYNPSQVTAGSQPDWYMGPAEGAVRLMPGWESYLFGTTWSWNIAVPGLGFLGLLFTGLAIYPFFEQWFTGDRAEHHILDKPYQAPTRAAFGVAGMTMYAVVWLGGGNDLIATNFSLSINTITIVLRWAFFLAPIAAFIITRRICIGLMKRDLDRLLHGAESGTLRMSPEGGFSEDHLPISQDEAYALTQKAQLTALEASPTEDKRGVRHEAAVSKRRARASRWWFGGVPPKVTREQLEEAAAHHAHATDGHASSDHANHARHEEEHSDQESTLTH